MVELATCYLAKCEADTGDSGHYCPRHEREHAKGFKLPKPECIHCSADVTDQVGDVCPDCLEDARAADPNRAP